MIFGNGNTHIDPKLGLTLYGPLKTNNSDVSSPMSIRVGVIGTRGIRFFRYGQYPPLRGTVVKLSSKNYILYTKGYIPYLRTYPGPHIPVPLEILEHHGDSPQETVLAEILSLSKMNWNSADFGLATPITLLFSKKVGEVMASLPKDIEPQHEYRYYM